MAYIMQNLPTKFSYAVLEGPWDPIKLDMDSRHPSIKSLYGMN